MDDYGKAIYHSYTDKGTFWGELGRTLPLYYAIHEHSPWRAFSHESLKHLENAGHSLYDKPVGPIMDIASLFTGGGAAAGKLGAGLAKGAETGSVASRLGAKIAGLDAKTLEPLTHRVELSSGAGFDRKLARNPVVRGRQRAFEKIAGAVPSDTPVIGSDFRVARHLDRLEAHKAVHEDNVTMRPMRQALAGLHGLKRKAVWIAAGGHSVHDLEKLDVARVKMLEEEIAHKRSLPRSARKGDADPLQIGHTHGTDLVLYEGGVAKRVGGDEHIAHIADGDHHETMRGLLESDRRDSLKKNQRNLAAVTKRLAETRAIKAAGILDKPNAKIERAVAEAHKLSAITTKRIFPIDEHLPLDVRMENVRKIVNRSTLESQIMKSVGATDKVYRGATRSHVRQLQDKLDLRGGRAGMSYTEPGKLAEIQKNTGYNFFNGLDSRDPSMYLHSARQVFDHKARLDRFHTILDAAHWVSPKDARLLGGKYKVVKADGVLSRDMKEVADLMHNAEPVLAGSPLYDQFKNAIDGFLEGKDGVSDLVPVVPKRFYDELVGQFRESSAFVRIMIDNPTKVWRALTLNLRPAWIVNNYVGQMMMLAVAHGARGLGAYIEQFGKKGKLARELAPELGDLGWARDTVHDMASLPLHGKIARGIRSFSDFMGTLNQKLTDDPQRSAAWIAEMRPHVKRLMNADPSLSWEDAARHLWSEPHFADEVTQRVLSDMIDFNDLSNFERKAIKRVIPFYSWMKGITKRTSRLAADEPWKVSAALQASAIGQKSNQERFGDLPSFLHDLTPLHGNLVMKTAALNPFMTPSDILSMIGGAALPGKGGGPQNPLSTINPVFKAPLEALFQRDAFTGADLNPLHDKSFLGLLKQQTENSFAQKRLWDEWQKARAAQRGELPYQPIYAPSIQNAGLAYAGLPVRKLNRDAALARALKDSQNG